MDDVCVISRIREWVSTSLLIATNSLHKSSLTVPSHETEYSCVCVWMRGGRLRFCVLVCKHDLAQNKILYFIQTMLQFVQTTRSREIRSR